MNMKKMKKLLRLALLLAMLVGLAAVTAHAAGPSTLYVGDTNVVGGGYWLNDGSGSLTAEGAGEDDYNVRYDADSGILYLKGANITSYSTEKGRPGIYANGGSLTIHVEEDSTVDLSEHTFDYYSRGIYCYSGSLTIEGTAKLTVVGGNVTEGCETYGVWVKQNFTLEAGVTLDATGGEAPEGWSYGVYACGDYSKSCETVIRGTLIAQGGLAGKETTGFCVGYGPLNMEGGTVVATGGQCTNTLDYYYSVGVKFGDGLFGFGSVTATGGECTSGATSVGVMARKSSSGGANTGLIVKATGGDAHDGKSYGVYNLVAWNASGKTWLIAQGNTAAFEDKGAEYSTVLTRTNSGSQIYFRTSADGSFENQDTDKFSLNNYSGKEDVKYLEAVIDHVCALGDAVFYDGTTHSYSCVNEDLGACPLDYGEYEEHALDENNDCVCGHMVASVTDADGSPAGWYNTLQGAVNAAASLSGTKVTMLYDVKENITISAGTFTLDLNGKTLTGGDKTITLPEDAGVELTIDDSSDDGTGTIKTTGEQVLYIRPGNECCTINGGTFEGVIYVYTELVINDGTFKDEISLSNSYGRVGSLTVYGGTFYRTDLNGFIWSEGGKITLYSGTFIGGFKIKSRYSPSVLASGYGFYEGSTGPRVTFQQTASAYYSTYAAEGETVIVSKLRPYMTVITDKETYQYGEIIELTCAIDVEGVSGTLDVYRNGNDLVDSFSDSPLKTSNMTWISTLPYSPGEWTFQVSYTPHDSETTYVTACESAPIQITVTKAAIGLDNYSTYLDVSGLGEYTYDGSVRQVTHSLNANIPEANAPKYTITLLDEDGNEVEGIQNVGSVTVVLDVTGNDYFETVEDLVLGTITIIPDTPELSDVTYEIPQSCVYDGHEKAASVELAQELEGIGQMSVKYLKSGESEMTGNAPTDPGTYTVYACFEEGANFHAADVELGSFTITKAESKVTVTLTGEQGNEIDDFSNVFYEDTVTVTVTLTGTPDGEVPSGRVQMLLDDVRYKTEELTDGSCTFTLEKLRIGGCIMLCFYEGDDRYIGESETSYLSVVQTAVTLTVSDTEQDYDGTAHTVSFTNSTKYLTEDDFTVTYYQVDENSDTISQVSKAVSIGKYLYVVELKDTEHYCFDRVYTPGTSALPSDTNVYDNAGYMTVSIKMPQVQQPIYFTEGSVTAYVTDGTYQNTLVNPNGTTASYRSSNDAVASVDENGVVTLHKAGTVTIIATSIKEETTPVTASYTLTVAKQAVTVKLASGTTVTYGGEMPTAEDLEIIGVDSFEALEAQGELTFTGYTVGQNAGTYYITPAGITSEKYELNFQAAPLTVAPKAITAIHITAAAMDKVYDGSDDATVFFTGSGDILDEDQNDVTITGSGKFASSDAGIHSVTATATGLSGAKAGNYVLVDVTAETEAEILPATVVFEVGTATFLYDGTEKSVDVTAQCGGQAFTAFTVEYSGGERIQPGDYTVTIVLIDSGNYTGAPDAFTMTIEPADQDLLVISGMPGILDYGRTFCLTTSAGADAVVTWTSSDGTVASVDAEGNVTILDVDKEVTITAYADRTGYKTQSACVTFTPVAKQVSFRLRGLNTVYNGEQQGVTVIPSVDGMTDYTVTYTDENGDVTEPVNAGVYHVEVTAVGGRYEGYTTGTLTIRQAQLTGSVTMEGWTYGEEAKEPAFTVDVEGIEPVYTYAGPGLVDGLPYGAGDYTVTAVFTAQNYETLAVSAEFTIRKAVLTVTAADITRGYGENDPAFTLSFQGFVDKDSESDILVLPTAVSTAVRTSDIGEYEIVPFGGRAENYEFAYVNGTLQVTAAQGMLLISGSDHNVHAGDILQLYGSINGTVPELSWSSSDPAVAEVDENGQVTVLKAGSATITATVEGGNYTAAPAAFALKAEKRTVTLVPETTVFAFNGQTQSMSFLSVDGFTPVVGENVLVSYVLTTDPTVTVLRDVGTYSVTYKIEDPAYQGNGVLTVTMNRLPDGAVETLCPSRSFTDIEMDAWYHEFVDYVVYNGLMNGVSDTAFAPGVTTSRGMIATILYRMEGEPKVCGSSFNDVEAGSYYEKAVIWAAANGIVKGYGDGNFGPNDEITREQIAAILYRYAQYKGYDVSDAASLSDYADAEQISEYAQEAMSWANAMGLINGRPGGILDPKGSATRCEAAAILTRFILAFQK